MQGLISGRYKNRVFQFSEAIRSGESQEGICDGNPLEEGTEDLHAKVFIGSKNGYSHWFMGSANCTQPAFLSRNIEFMAELKSDQTKLNPSRIAKSLTESPGNDITLFEPYQLESRSSDEGEKSLDNHLRKIISSTLQVSYFSASCSRVSSRAHVV